MAGLRRRPRATAAGTAAARTSPATSLGHYLSAVSLMWAATGDARFKERADYIVERTEGSAGRATATATSARSRAGGSGSREVAQRRHPLGRLRPERSLVALVHAAQDLRRPARRLPVHRQPRRRWRWRSSSPPGPRASSRKLERRADPADAQHRVRRHERGAGRSLRRHRRRALAGAVRTASSTTPCSTRSSATRTAWPACTATPRCPS